MQTAVLELTIWCFSYYPTRSSARGRHTTRTHLKPLRSFAMKRLAARPLYRYVGRHRAATHRARGPAPLSPRRRTSDDRDCGPAF